MAKRESFASYESYCEYKQREYDRYYVSTQLYPPKRWEDWEDEVLLNCQDMTARQLSAILERSIKSIEHRKAVLRKRGLPIIKKGE